MKSLIKSTNNSAQLHPIFVLTPLRQHLLCGFLVSGRRACSVQIANFALHNHNTIANLVVKASPSRHKQ